MTQNNLAVKGSKLTCLISLLWITILSYPLQAQALGNKTTHTSHLIAQIVPRGIGSPETGRRRGGTSRSNQCPNWKTPLTALVPGDETGQKSELSLTVAKFPKFWVFLPSLSKDINTGEFVLQDKQGKDIYRTKITLPQNSAFIGINLPFEPKYALEEGDKYHWYFRIFCGNSDKTSEYVHVDAWVQRVRQNPALVEQLEANKSQQYRVYKKNNILHDAVSNLAESRAASPNSSTLIQDWKQLLTSLGLQELAEVSSFQTANVKK